jgi:NAD(P)-dependent dehydrogenase (short-subunit alcohol dehydrogenase family)
MIDPPTIFITGAASGIGRAVAARFAARDWVVGLADRNGEALATVKDTLRTDRVYTYPLDVRDRHAVRSVVKQFGEVTDGRLDVLVNSAGVMTVGRFEETDLDAHREHLSVNLWGVMTVAHAAFSMLKDTPGARMVSIASGSGLYGTPEMASYSASKAGVRSLTQSLNLEWDRHDIHVCDVIPPYVDSPMTQSVPETKSMERLGVLLTPDDVADVVDQALQEEKIHWPVGKQFSWLYRASEMLPSPLNRLLMRYVSGF